MKKFITIILTFLLGTVAMNAQSMLERLGKSAVDRAKWRIESKVHQKVDEKVDEAMDGVLNGRNDSKKEKAKDRQDRKQTDSDAHDYEERAEREQKVSQPAKQAKNIEMNYAKSDFVPGDEIIFEDTMDSEQLGEFPSQWDLIQGTAEVASIDGKKAICFVDNSSTTAIEPLMKNPEAYLPEIFTIEYDFFIKNKSDNIHYHPYLVGDVMDRTNEDLLHIAMFGNGNGEYSATKPDLSDVKGKFDFSDGIKEGDWNHFALSFNKRACKVYINGVRYVNIPNMQAPKRFRITGSWWNDTPSEYITNIRIAQGAVPLYDRMMTDGKFITYGITFDVGKSVIKPESMSEINRIVQLMNENPTLKFSVEGHTDSTGNAASNQTLSEARSQAIVDKLVELGIAKDRLSATGKGQNSPIADNSTDEGRAKNRRVEFVKL